MKEAIQKAIEGGWRDQDEGKEVFVEIEDDGVDGKLIRLFDNDTVECINEIPIERAFLDPLFWKSLGKALGWSKCTMYSFSTGKVYSENEWLYNWHRFIDWLVENKDIDEFFKELLK